MAERHWLLIAALVVLLVAPPSAPVGLSYVYSDSMEPTLRTGDGYVLVPSGEIHAGDIVTFRSAESGDLVTHRVVDVTADGLVTKGDANEVTDQAAGHDHVDRSAVEGTVLTVGGTVVRIPGLGDATTTTRENPLAVAGAVVGLLLLLELRREDSSDHQRPVHSGELITPVLLGLGVFAVAMVFVGASTHSLSYVAVDGDSDHPKRLTVGERASKPVLLEGAAPALTHQAVSADGMDVTAVTGNGSRLRATVSIPPPESRGPYPKTIQVYHYPATLPESALGRLHAVHPLLAAIAAVSAALVPLCLLVALLVDVRRPFRPARSRTLRRLLE